MMTMETILDLSPAHLVTKIFLFHALAHTQSFFDPNGMARTYMKRNLDSNYQIYALQTGTASVLCCAFMVYAAAYENIDFVDIVKFGNIIPVAYLIIQLVTGAYHKSGVSADTIKLLTVVTTLFELALWFNVGDSKIVAKMFLIPPLLQGLSGYIAPVANARRILGVDISKNNMSQYIHKWMAMEIGLTSLVPAVVLYGGNWKQCVACVILAMVCFTLDVVTVSRLAEKSGMPVKPKIIIASIYSLMAYTLLS